MDYAQKVATDLIATIPTLLFKITDATTGEKHEWEIKSVNDLNACYVGLQKLQALDEKTLVNIANSYGEMLNDWSIAQI